MNKIIRITTVPVSLLILLKSQIKFMSDYYEVVAVSSGGKMLEEVAEQAKVRVFDVEMTRKITPIRDLIALVGLYHIMRRERPLIVHTHTPKAGLLGMIAARLARVPIRLHTVAGMPLLESTGFKRKVLNLTERVTYAFSTKVYPNSNNMMEIIIANNYCDSKKLKVIGNGSTNGIDTHYFDPALYSSQDRAQFRINYGIEDSEILYCFIGRMVKDKGVQELVEAFNNLQKINSKIKLILVGPFEDDLDPLDELTQNIIKNNNAIIHVGFQKDVRTFLAMSDIFVFPSYREGFPNVVMQAGAMGLPSIVTDINGCNEIVIPGENGLIIPTKNVSSLQSAMTDMEASLDKWNNKVCRQMIVDRYDHLFVCNELLQEYKECELSVK